MNGVDLSKKYLSILFVLSSIMGILFVVLFYNSNLGLNYFIYSCIFTAIIFFFIKDRKNFNKKVFITLSIIVLLLSSIYFRSTFELFRSFNFFIVPALLAYIAYASLGTNNKNPISDILSQLFYPIGKIDKYIKKGINLLTIKTKLNNNSKMMGIIIGILLCIVLVIIILPLMASADIVFGYFINDLLSCTANLSLFDSTFQIILALAAASYFFAFIYYIFSEKKPSSINEWNADIVKNKNVINYTLIETVCKTILIVLNILYLLFSIVQFNYLFLKNTASLPVDFTYSQYARSGFFEMLTLTIINFIIIMAVRYATYKNNKNNFIKVLLSLITFANYIMIASAFYRMFLYESTYGYTRLRLLVYLFLILESVLMILVLYGVWNMKFKVIYNGIIVIGIFYLILNFVNIDGYIVKKNIDRYYDTGKIDIFYLCRDLSDDALPQLERLIDDKNLEIRIEVKERFNNAFNSYKWQEYNISKSNSNKFYKKYAPTQN